jgi:probable phosphoglycerate mutase
VAVKRNAAIMMCLVPCGETEWDLSGRIQGAADLPLSDEGRLRVEGEAARLGLVRASLVHHPPDEAATVTAELCAHRIRARTKSVPELADPHLGLLEGLTEQEFSERFPSRYRQWEDDPVSLSPPEGEDMIAAADRIFRAVAKILRRSRSEEVAVVLHRLALAMMRCWLSDRPLSEVRLVLADQPRVERYAVPLELVGSLETAAQDAAGYRLSATS